MSIELGEHTRPTWILDVRTNRSAVSADQLRQAWQNRQPSREPVRLGVLVRALVHAEGLNKPTSPLASLGTIWEELVGVELSRHSRLEGLRRGTLRIQVDSAAHMAELKGLVQGGLAKQLSERFEDGALRTIRLRLGSRSASEAAGRARPARKDRRRSC